MTNSFPNVKTQKNIYIISLVKKKSKTSKTYKNRTIHMLNDDITNAINLSIKLHKKKEI